MIEQVWNNINISTLLILKLFDHICEKCFSAKYDKINYRIPIHYICYDYGLLDCYLDFDCLVLVFDQQTAISDHKKTKSNYWSFLDRLSDSDEYVRLENINDLILVWLKIPNKFKADVRVLKTSKYSKVSKAFKKKMLMEYTRVDGKIKLPSYSHLLSKYIVIGNIPAKVVNKSKSLRNEINKSFGVTANKKSDVIAIDAPIEKDYYITWKPEIEEWSMDQLKKYQKEDVNTDII